MTNKTKTLITTLLFAAIFIVCKNDHAAQHADYSFAYKSYRDIPGVTAEEIEAIAELRKNRTALVYGMEASAESFVKDDGSIGGFAAHFTNWLSELFDIPFVNEIHDWDELLSGLESHTIDFSGDLTPTPERQQVYFMTSPIAMRTVKMMRTADGKSQAEIYTSRAPRYVFIKDAVTYSQVAPYLSENSDITFFNTHAEVYNALKNYEADIFFEESPYEAAFDAYGDIVAEDFFPLIYGPVSLTTRNPELAPIISVVQKALDNGASRYLTELYNRGYRQYQNNKFYSQLTDKEKAYINRHNESGLPIPIGMEFDNYPTSFYNTQRREWQGVSLDVLLEVEKITGLRFAIAHDELLAFSLLADMLESGEIALLSEVIPTPDRTGRFLWSEPYGTDYYALISLAEFKDIEINEILYLTVGLQKDVADTEIFWQWFPNHQNTVEYKDALSALDALERGEIDVFMGTRRLFIAATNYLEKPGYKANIVFNRTYDAAFGINIDEPELQSIINKTLRFINTKAVNERWMTRVFDYRSAAARAQMPYLIAAVLSLFAVIILLCVMFVRNKISQKRKNALLVASYEYVEKMNKSLTKIAKSPEFSAGALTKVADLISEEVHNILHVTRVEVLTMKEDKKTMKYISCFERGKHVEKRPDYELAVFPEYERLLRAERLLTTSNPAMYDTLIKSRDDYSQKTSACLDAPIWINGKLAGIVCIEQEKNEQYPRTRAWTAEEHNFATTLADFFALTMANERRHRLEAAEIMLAAEKEIAERTSQNKSDFLVTMSHEIRTPMNAIIGISQIQLQKRNVPIEYAEAFEKIYSSGSALLGIINDVLDMSKIETGKMELYPIEYDVPSLINDTVQLNAVRIGTKEIDFIVDADKNLPARMCGDELRLKQILNNLLSNAIKYTQEGYVKLKVEHFVQDGAPMLRFTVEDTGQGMKPEDLKRMFSGFMRFNSETNRTIEGTGIGLNITKKLVELMDGEILFESEYGKGSKFIATVKQKAVKCGEIGLEVSQKLRDFTFVGQKRFAEQHIDRFQIQDGKVLVVDDVETNLFVADGLLSAYGLKIEMANSGYAAIERVESGKVYDIIFMDQMMPGIDGIETTKRLRGMGYKGAIVALTANAVYGVEDMFLKNGFNDFLSKPIDTVRLNSVLQMWIPIEKQVAADDSEKKQPEDGAEISIDGVDIELGLARTGGTVDRYMRTLSVFYENSKSVIEGIKTALAENNMTDYVTRVHGLKGASANIGATALSDFAKKLEEAGREDNKNFINEQTPNLLEKFEKLLRNIENALNSAKENAGADDIDIDALKRILADLKTALNNIDTAAINAAVSQLKPYENSPRYSSAIGAILNSVLNGDYDGAIEKADALVY